MTTKTHAARTAAGALLRSTHNALFGYMVRAGLIACAVPMVVDKLDAVPEAQRGLYKPDGDKFRLDVEGYEDPVGLKSALEKERTNAKDAVAQAKAWKALGKTPEEIQALLEAQAQAERDKLTKAGEWDKLRGQMTEQHQTELKAREEAAGKLRTQLERRIVDAEAVAALAAAEGNAALLLPHVKASVKVVEHEGELVTRIVDEAGNPRVNGKGEFLTIRDLVAEMRANATFAPGFKAPAASGGGAGHGGGNGGAGTKGKIDGTPAERTAYFASKYPDLKTT
jgi:DNA-binding transcriptional MerR regulator